MKRLLVIGLCLGLAACSSTSSNTNTAKTDKVQEEKKNTSDYGNDGSPMCQSTGSRLKKKC